MVLSIMKEQEQDVVLLGALLDGAPGRGDGDHAEKRGEHDEEHADAVGPKRIFRADGGDPVGGFLERVITAAGREMEHEGKRDNKAEHAEEIAHQAVKHLRLARNE